MGYFLDSAVQVSEEHHKMFGLYYYAYRYYDPETGRWPSRDLIWERGGLNLYAFLDNNCISHLDVLGLNKPYRVLPLPKAPEFDPGQLYKKWLKEFYERKNKEFSIKQKTWISITLAKGCIGVTCLELGDAPNKKNCFNSKKKAEDMAELNKNAGVCPKPGIYSIHLYDDAIGGTGEADVTFDSHGRADLSKWDESPKPSEIINGEEIIYVNFDYGFFGDDGLWWGADLLFNPDYNFDGLGDLFPNDPFNNHPNYFKREDVIWNERYDDFNLTVWCYQCCNGTYGE